jgi:hypothetical protein
VSDEIMIEARNAKGYQRLVGGDDFFVSIRGFSAVEAHLTDEADGTYRVSFNVPGPSGVYKVTVMLGGEPLAGSPFKLKVKPASDPYAAALAEMAREEERRKEEEKARRRKANAKTNRGSNKPATGPLSLHPPASVGGGGGGGPAHSPVGILKKATPLALTEAPGPSCSQPAALAGEDMGARMMEDAAPCSAVQVESNAAAPAGVNPEDSHVKQQDDREPPLAESAHEAEHGPNDVLRRMEEGGEAEVQASASAASNCNSPPRTVEEMKAAGWVQDELRPDSWAPPPGYK